MFEGICAHGIRRGRPSLTSLFKEVRVFKAGGHAKIRFLEGFLEGSLS